MLGALISICIFFITVFGILLLKPEERASLRDYSNPPALEERKKVTLKMAKFLEKNPKIVEQPLFKTLPLSEPFPRGTAEAPSPSNRLLFEAPLTISFQGEPLQFKSHDELNQWIYSKAQEDPVGFLVHLETSLKDQTELYLDTLNKVSEINPDPGIASRIKGIYLKEARKLLQIKDGFHQQMMQKALQSYLDLEKDRDLGKKTAAELLRESGNQ